MRPIAAIYAEYSEDLIALFAVASSLDGQLAGAAEAAEDARRAAAEDSELLSARANAAVQRAETALRSVTSALRPSDLRRLDELSSRPPASAPDPASIAERAAEEAKQAAKLVQESASALGAEEDRLKREHQKRRDRVAMTAATVLALLVPFGAGIVTGSILAVVVAVVAGVAAACILAFTGTTRLLQFVVPANGSSSSTWAGRIVAARISCGRCVAVAGMSAVIGSAAARAVEPALFAAAVAYLGRRNSKKHGLPRLNFKSALQSK
jgi:hypothetical protein